MSTIYSQVLDVLRRHLSDLHAVSILDRALRELGRDADSLSFADIPEARSKLERRTRLFVDSVVHAKLVSELSQLCPEPPSSHTRVVSLQREDDVSTARLTAKAMCEGGGVRSFVVHRVVTIVSELARNVIQYTPGGAVELSVIRERPLRMAVVATDTGKGIAELERILAGTYRSKTGMGRGLLGVKRLSDNFSISTGAKGTRIELWVCL